MKYIFTADKKTRSASLYAWWKIAILLGFILLILFILVPRNLLVTTLTTSQPSKVFIGYLQAFQKKHPRNIQVQLALIEHEIGVGHLKQAKQKIARLKSTEYPLSSELALQLNWMNYLLVRYQAQQAKLNTKTRILYLKQSRRMIKKLANTSLKKTQLKTLANDSLGLANPEVALKIYNTLMKKGDLTTAEELAEGGHIAMQNNKAIESVIFYKAALAHAKTLHQKKIYALHIIQALWAGNEVQKALTTAQQFPSSIINNPDTLMYLAQLALAANQIQTAQDYLLRALGLPDTKVLNWNQTLKKLTYNDKGFELLFRILLYQKNIKAAYQVAHIAVTQQPNNLTWHTKLAQTATWAGEYDIGMKQWTYVVQHEEDINKIKYAISTARKLSYDLTVVKMLNIYLAKHPEDTQAALELALAQNRIGEPQQALLTLKNLHHAHASRRAIQVTKAHIYQDVNQWDKALNTWKQIDATYGASVNSVMAQASIYYKRGQPQRALTILKQGIAKAQRNDLNFWNMLGELAWFMNDRPFAILGYSHDLNNASHLLALIELEKLSNPEQALNYSLTGWSRFRKPLFFDNALYLLEHSNRMETLARLYASATPQELTELEQRAIFWQALASLYANTRTPKIQASILEQGISRHPKLHQLKTNLLWFVLGSGHLLHAKTLMKTWYEQELMHDSDLWHVFAEGFAVFNQLKLAIAIYQQHLPQYMDNDQVIIDYANLLEKAHHNQQAYTIRHELWKKILSETNQHVPLRYETLQAISQLSRYMLSGTEQLKYVSMLIKNYPQDQSLNTLVNWSIQHNHFNVLAYFTAYYMNKPLSDRIAIYLALLNNDLPTLQNIMAQAQNTWPRSDRINAAVRLNNTPLAETLAFNELTERPDAHEIYPEFTIYSLIDANAFEITPEYEQFVNLIGPEVIIKGKQRLTNTWKIHPHISTWNLRTTTPETMRNVPTEDFLASIKLEQKTQHGNIIYGAGYRKAVGGFAPLDLEWNHQLDSQWYMNLNLGFNQKVFQTSYLYIGGIQDKLGINLFYNFEKYNRLEFSLQGHNYHSQDRHYLGNGYFLQGLYLHKFWLSYPDFTLGLFANVYGFNRNGSFGGDITRLFPPLTPEQQADPALAGSTKETYYQDIIPPSYHEAGFIFKFGDAILDYTHAVRPYCWANVYYNSFVGFSYTVKVGMNGSVLGRDSLLIFAERGISPAVLNAINQKIGLRYRLYF